MMYSPSPHTTMKRPVCVMGGGLFRVTRTPYATHTSTDQPHIIKSTPSIPTPLPINPIL